MTTHRRATWLTLALAVSVLFNLAFLGTALFGIVSPPSHPQGRPAPHPPGSDGQLLSALHLSSSQLESVELQRKSTALRIEQHRAEVSDARSRLWALVAGDSASQEALSRELDAVSQAQRDIQEAVVLYMQWLRTQLTPEQTQTFDTVVLERMCKCPSCDGGCMGGCQHQEKGQFPEGAPGAGLPACQESIENKHGGEVSPCGCGDNSFPLKEEVSQ